MSSQLTRTDFFKLGGAAALGAALFPNSALATLERQGISLLPSAKTLKLANDKVTWKPWFNTAGKDAAKNFELALLPLQRHYPAISAWCERIRALPGYDRTYPPHWRAAPPPAAVA